MAGVINTSSGAAGKMKEMGARKAQADSAKKSAEALEKLSAAGAAANAESAPHLGDNTGGGGNKKDKDGE